MSKLVDELKAERQRLVKRLAAVDALGALSSPVWNLQFPPSEKEPAEVLAARSTEKREGTADDADYAEGSAGASPHQEQTQTTKVLAGQATKKSTKKSRDGSATGVGVPRKGGNLAAAVRDFLDHEVVDGQEFGLGDVRDYVRRVHPEIPEDKLMGVAVTLTDLRDRGLVDRVGNERPAKYRRCQRKAESTTKSTKNTEVLAGRAIRRMERAGTALPLEAGKVADRYEEFRKGIPGLNGAAAEEEGEVGNP